MLPVKRCHDESCAGAAAAAEEDLPVTAADGGSDEMAREALSLEVVWKGSERYPLMVPKYATVSSIKGLLEELTEVEAEGQKLLGL
ncbi:hypothetical protein IWQ56_006693, partial [Coemansia nantahalensis]